MLITEAEIDKYVGKYIKRCYTFEDDVLVEMEHCDGTEHIHSVSVDKGFFWEIICRFCPTESLLKHEEYVNWKAASGNMNLTLDLIREHKSEINFFILSCWFDQEDFLTEFKNEINASMSEFKNRIKDCSGPQDLEMIPVQKREISRWFRSGTSYENFSES